MPATKTASKPAAKPSIPADAGKGKAAREVALESALGFLKGERKGKPTHNRDIARAIGIDSEVGFARLYGWMKDDERFEFRPENLSAAFALAPVKK